MVIDYFLKQIELTTLITMWGLWSTNVCCKTVIIHHNTINKNQTSKNSLEYTSYNLMSTVSHGLCM